MVIGRDEGRVAREQDVGYHPDAPHVRRGGYLNMRMLFDACEWERIMPQNELYNVPQQGLSKVVWTLPHLWPEVAWARDHTT